VLRSVSRVPKVQAASERMGAVGIRILGAVMSGVSGDVYGTEYYSATYSTAATATKS